MKRHNLRFYVLCLKWAFSLMLRQSMFTYIFTSLLVGWLYFIYAGAFKYTPAAASGTGQRIILNKKGRILANGNGTDNNYSHNYFPFTKRNALAFLWLFHLGWATSLSSGSLVGWIDSTLACLRLITLSLRAWRRDASTFLFIVRGILLHCIVLHRALVLTKLT